MCSCCSLSALVLQGALACSLWLWLSLRLMISCLDQLLLAIRLGKIWHALLLLPSAIKHEQKQIDGGLLAHFAESLLKWKVTAVVCVSSAAVLWVYLHTRQVTKQIESSLCSLVLLMKFCHVSVCLLCFYLSLCHVWMVKSLFRAFVSCSLWIYQLMDLNSYNWGKL